MAIKLQPGPLPVGASNRTSTAERFREGQSGRAASEAMAAQGRATHPVVQASPLLSKIQRNNQKKCKKPNKKPEIQLRRLAEEFAAKGSGDELPKEDGKQVMQCDATASSINQLWYWKKKLGNTWDESSKPRSSYVQLVHSFKKQSKWNSRHLQTTSESHRPITFPRRHTVSMEVWLKAECKVCKTESSTKEFTISKKGR